MEGRKDAAGAESRAYRKAADERVLGVRVTPSRRLAFFVGTDALLVGASILLAILLRFEGIIDLSTDLVSDVVLIASVAALTTVASLALLGAYRVAWSFVGLRDVARVALAVAVATLVMGVVVQLAHQMDALLAFPRSVVLIQAPLTFCALSGFRLSKRALRLARGQRQASSKGIRTLLVGAGDAGAQVLKSIQVTGAPYDVRGFLDDDPLARRTVIYGVPVLGPVSELASFAKANGVEVVILCVASATSPWVQDVVKRAREAGVTKVRIVPSLSEIVDGHVTIGSTREVKLEDLLGREAIEIHVEEVRSLLEGKRVLVTGGAGTIGSELCRQIARFAPAKLTILDVDETRLHDISVDLAAPGLSIGQALVDVRDARALRDLFAAERPQVVFHAAAYKHVPMMELYPLAALEANVLGTANVVRAAEDVGAERFILISTDKAVEPSSVMGASKRLAELVVFGSAGGRMVRSAVRFGNVIGSRGSVIPTFDRQLKQGGPLTVTHPDMERFFMMTSEAVSLVLQSAALGNGRDIFVLDMGKPVRILDVAREFVRLHGFEPDVDVKIVFTGLRPGEKLVETLTYATEAPRPTAHPRVLRVETGSLFVPPQLLDTVQALVDERDAREAVAYVRHLFPTIGEAEHAARTTLLPSAAPLPER